MSHHDIVDDIAAHLAAGGNLLPGSWPPPVGAPLPPCDHAPLIREQQQRITSLEAENRSLREQLHRKEDLLAAYRRANEADDAERMTAAPAPEETTT